MESLAADRLGRDGFAAFGQILNWPALGNVAAGEPAWRAIADGGPETRADALPPWCCPELIATEGSRARLSRWIQAGQPNADPAHRAGVIDGGLAAVVDSVDRVLRRLPAPIAWHVVRTVAIVGCHPGGWAGLAPRFPESPDEGLQLVAVASRTDQDALDGVVAHEFCHCWLARVFPDSARVTVAEGRRRRETFVRLAVEWGYRSQIIDAAVQPEDEATALLRALGFVGFAADAAHCMATAVERAVNETAKYVP
jgi:hypothetical protein